MPHSSLEKTLEELQRQAPNSTFLALGQTVFWDEPLKATWRRTLDRHWPSAQLVAGVHDTDYFAKTTAHVPDDQEFLALAHDDGATRGLWSAAGELSSLLGSEDVPTRAFYESLGIPFDSLAGHDATARRLFFAEYTAAFGWRGVVQTSGSAQIAHDVPAKKFGPALLSLLEWGFNESFSCLDTESAEKAMATASEIRTWIAEFLTECTETCTLTDIYCRLLPKFYELLLDIEPSNFSVTATSSLLRFHQSTASLPRFHFVNHFLNPETRAFASAAYSKAVAGGGMYALDHFGENAIPFDVVVPGAGRGTLHIGSDYLQIDFAPHPLSIKTASPITDTTGLAAALADELGENVILVGKAVSLISMLAAEFVLVFHETASGYTDRTAEMNNSLRKHGITVDLNPILRLQYSTWDSLDGVTGVSFRLPEHLASSFNTENELIDPSEFAREWRSVVHRQSDKLFELASLRSLRSLLSYLADAGSAKGDIWSARTSDLLRNREIVQSNYQSTAELRERIVEIRYEIRIAQAKRHNLEEKSGKDFRLRLRPLYEQGKKNTTETEEIERDRKIRYSDAIVTVADKQKTLKRQLRELQRAKRTALRPTTVLAAQAEIKAIEREANLEKMKVARNAYLTKHGLPHMNARPTSWWLPMVDPTGTWFDNITDSLEARLEPV